MSRVGSIVGWALAVLLAVGCASTQRSAESGEEWFEVGHASEQLRWSSFEDVEVTPFHYAFRRPGLRFHRPRFQEYSSNRYNDSPAIGYVPNVTLTHVLVPELDGLYPERDAQRLARGTEAYDEEAYDELRARAMGSNGMRRFLKSENPYLHEVDPEDVYVRFLDARINVESWDRRELNEVLECYVDAATSAAVAAGETCNRDVWTRDDWTARKRRDLDADAWSVNLRKVEGPFVHLRITLYHVSNTGELGRELRDETQDPIY